MNALDMILHDLPKMFLQHLEYTQKAILAVQETEKSLKDGAIEVVHTFRLNGAPGRYQVVMKIEEISEDKDGTDGS